MSPPPIQAELAGWYDRPPFDWQVARLAAYRGSTRVGALSLPACPNHTIYQAKQSP
ncbi:MAG TPA: hypothetical protein VFA46_02590 [Actinomycetes bacterium]|nr:hypothetical protein [Actinomycetes bacterium]